MNLHARFSAIQYIHNVHTHAVLVVGALLSFDRRKVYYYAHTEEQAQHYYVYCAAVRRQCV